MTSLSRGRFLMMLSALVLAGCGGSGSDNTLPVSRTEYNLQSAASKSLPSVVIDQVIPTPEGGHVLRFVVSGGQVVLTGDGKYTQSIDFVSYVDGAAQPVHPWTDNGVYTLSGNNIHFESNYIENRRYDGTLTENGLTITNDISGEELPSVTYTYDR